MPGSTPSVIACGDATLPLLSLRDIFPRPGEVGPQGDGFRGGGKVSGVAIRRPLGGAGERSEPEGVLGLTVCTRLQKTALTPVKFL